MSRKTKRHGCGLIDWRSFRCIFCRRRCIALVLSIRCSVSLLAGPRCGLMHSIGLWCNCTRTRFHCLQFSLHVDRNRTRFDFCALPIARSSFRIDKKTIVIYHVFRTENASTAHTTVSPISPMCASHTFNKLHFLVSRFWRFPFIVLLQFRMCCFFFFENGQAILCSDYASKCNRQMWVLLNVLSSESGTL